MARKGLLPSGGRRLARDDDRLVQCKVEEAILAARFEESLQRRGGLEQYRAQARNGLRSAAHAGGPGLELHFFGCALLVNDREAGLLDQVAPLRHAEAAAVARVTQPFKRIVDEGSIAQLNRHETRC